MKNRRLAYFAAAVILLLSAFYWKSKPAKAPKELTILHFNDVYELEPQNGGNTGGAARVQTLLDSYKNANPLITFGGDAFGGSAISLAEKGKPMVVAFNRLGLDYAVFGNHEFDFGLENVLNQVKDSRFIWIVSNLLDKKTGLPPAGALPYAVTEWNGIKIGIIGLIGNWLDETKDGDKIVYQDYISSGRRYARMARAKGAQVVIALTHMHLRHDKKLAREAGDEIDLILGGHDHDPISTSENGVTIFKSGSDWINVGRLELSVPQCGKPEISANFLPVSPQIHENAEFAKIVAQYAKKRDAADKASIGSSEVDLDTREEAVRLSESPVGNLITDAMREATKADIAITNGGGIRSKQLYPAGPISMKMIRTMLPFPNKVLALKLTGAQVRAALENGVSNYENIGGRFPQVSGISFEFDPNLPSGKRILRIDMNGKPLDPDKYYTVATLDFLANGGDGYVAFKDSPRLIDDNAAGMYAETIANYILRKGIVAPEIEGRIKKVKAP